MHTGEELEAHYVDKRRLSCDSDAPQVGTARSDTAKVVKENRRKTNHRKTRPYCIILLGDLCFKWSRAYCGEYPEISSFKSL